VQVGPCARVLVEMTPKRLEEALPEVIGALQETGDTPRGSVRRLCFPQAWLGIWTIWAT
jgi:hypothetical protein